MKFNLTPGQQDDSAKATALLEGLTPRKVIADKRYDSNQILKAIQQQRAVAVIPLTAERTVRRPYSKKNSTVNEAKSSV